VSGGLLLAEDGFAPAPGYVEDMSNHFTGLSLGPPMGDQRLDLCDLYAFPSPANPDHTVLILNANPNADALHPGAIYRLAIDNDGDLRDDIAFSFVFSEPVDGRQTVDVFLAHDSEAESAEAVGERIFEAVEVSSGTTPVIAQSDSVTFFAGPRSDAFFFDFDGIKSLFDITGGRNFTAPHLGGTSPWTGVDSNLAANVFSIAIELPTTALGAHPDIRIWGAVAGAVHPSDGAHRRLRPRRGDRRHRRRRHPAGHAELRPVQAGEVPQRPHLHRRRHRLSAGVPDQRRLPAVRAGARTPTR
jgi:hypothetical protein